MMYRIPPYVREVKRRLGTFLTQDWVSRLIVVIGITGVLVIGVLTVEALLRFFVLVIALVAIGLGGRFWWLHRAMPPAAPRKDAGGRTIESEYVVIDRQVTSRKRKLRKDKSRVK
jgi:hypothetical protein